MTPKTGMTQSLAALLLGGAFIASQAVADPHALDGDIAIGEGAEASYVNVGGNAIRTGLGECLRLGGFSDDAIENACEGIEEAAEEVAAPEPEPAPVATAPAEPIISTSLFDAEALFDTNQSALTASAEASLADLLASLERFDNISAIKVTGHTDSRGSEAYNQTLSEARAATVSAFLASAYPNVSISSAGEGESSPVATNSTPEGRQQNRRVEVQVTAESIIQPAS